MATPSQWVSSLLQRGHEVGRPVRGAETAPGNEVGARGDRRRGIELEERQPLDEGREIGRPLGIEKLGPDGDPAGLLAAQPANGFPAGRGDGLRPRHYSLNRSSFQGSALLL